MDRREALAKLGLTALSGAALAGCESGDQDSTGNSDMVAEPSADDGLVELLFVQTSSAIEYAGNSLTLVKVDPNTLYFADRPQDIAGFLSFKELVDLVGTGPDSFRDEPPNATLIVLADAEADAVVMELSEAPYVDGENLVFPSIKLIEGTPPARGEQSALFIDTIGRPMSPHSVAGRHRRHKRRRRKRARRPGPR